MTNPTPFWRTYWFIALRPKLAWAAGIIIGLLAVAFLIYAGVSAAP